MAVRLLWQLWILLAKNMRQKNQAFLHTSIELLGPLVYAAMVYGVLRHRDPVRLAPPTTVDYDNNSFYNPSSYILGYAPANEVTEDLMFRAARLANQKYHTDLEAVGFVSEYQMSRFVREHPGNIHSIYAFDNMTSWTKKLPETLHLILRPVINSEERREIPKEFKYDLNAMQLIMESYIYALIGQEQQLRVSWSLNSTRTSVHQTMPELIETISVLYSLMLGYLIYRSVYCMACERESGVLKLLSKTGVNMCIYWLSWFITVFLIIWLASLTIGGMMFVEPKDHRRVFLKSDLTAVLGYFTIFAASLTSYCIMGSVFCQKADTASIISACFFMGSSFPLQIVSKREFNMFFACFLLNKNVHMTIVSIDDMEREAHGFTFNSIETVQFAYFSVSLCGLVYAVAATILFQCVVNKRPICTIIPRWNYMRAFMNVNVPYRTMIMSEDHLSHLQPGIVIDKLCADRPDPLGELSFTIYEGHVTVISDLDGNSSTTLLSILTGENRPLMGTVMVGKLNIVKDCAKIKKMTSLCPKEQTATFNTFTVLENLTFFHKIKSACQGSYRASGVTEVIEMFELNKCQDTLVGRLTAAEKRLLQIAMVYVGNSKILLFDCPTLDMDPYTKSKSWNVIRRNTEDKIVVVCTESIEEAEMVGDMIAVVSGGLLRSYGTIDHIYYIYGIGYNLLIDKEDHFDRERLLMIVSELIDNATIVEESIFSLVILLPMQTASVFSHLLTFIDNNKTELGIAWYSMNTVSLEEAILEKSTEQAMLELHEMQPTEFPIDADKKYQMFLSNIHESFTSESNVDRLMLSPSVAEVKDVSGKAGVKKNSAEELEIARYTGWRLVICQTEALLKKKITLSVCSVHLEILQVMILVILAIGLHSEHISLNTAEMSLNPRSEPRIIARVANVDAANPLGSQLVQRYIDQFANFDIASVEQQTNEQLMQGSIHDDKEFEEFSVIGATFHEDKSRYESVALHSTRGTGAEDSYLPHSITAIMNAYLHYFTGNNTYYMYASKLPETHSQTDLMKAIKTITRTVRIYRHHGSFIQAVSLLMVPYFAVLERTNGFKHLQHLSGVGPVMYWTVSLISDLITYLFLCLLYPVTATVIDSSSAIEIIDYEEFVMVTSGVVMILYIYVLQYAFTVPSSAAFLICMLNYFSGDAATFLNVLFGLQRHILKTGVDERIFLVLPPCIYPYYIFVMSEKYRFYSLCKSNSDYCNAMDPDISKHCCKLVCVDADCKEKKFTIGDMDGDMHIEVFISLVAHLVFWTVVLMLIEYQVTHQFKLAAIAYLNRLTLGVCRKDLAVRKSTFKKKTFNIQSLFNRIQKLHRVPSQFMNVDPGITEELMKLQNTPQDAGLIRIVEVYSDEANTPGLTRLNFLINKGESYCFVDMDKSTASQVLKVLGGMIPPTTGHVFVKGCPLEMRGKPTYTPIGYCMEMNSVPGALTGREILTFHAKLRGIIDMNLSGLVNSVLRTFQLQDKADTRSGNYSSSDQRLLNIAIAMIGDPEIILLDDPFGNLDVVNKSLVWQALDKSLKLGSSVIMCSDKIREVSDKVAVVVILLNGEPVCVGSPQSIRNRYCGSYTLLAKLDISNRNLPIETLISSLKERFPKCVIFYDHQDFLHMRIPYEDTTLPDVFALMESAKKHFKMHSYKLVHTNLSYVITAMQQRIVEDSVKVDECEVEGDDYDELT